MPKRPPISKSEFEIIRIVWRLGEATVRQVADELPKTRKIDFFTVQTFLRRLDAKGYLRKKQKGHTNIYRSRVRPHQVMGELIDEFMDRLFDGEALPLFQHVIHERGLNEEEIEKLQETLNQLKEKNP